MRALSWLVRAFIFFTLFAFALNNQQSVELHWFFGLEWRTRMVFVVLAAFAAGSVLGMLAVLPGWRRERHAAPPPPTTPATPSAPMAAPVPAPDFVPESRLRQGL